MKKMMIVAIACLAIGVQAGTAKWSAANLKTPGALTTALAMGNNVKAELFYTSGANGTLGSGGTSITSGALTAAGTKAATTFATAAEAPAYMGSPLNVYIVVYYNSNSGTTVTGMGNATHYWVSTVSSKSLANIATSDVSYAFAGSTTMVWTAVPEPTSMALLAIGGAVFGLRRKFKKA